MVYIDDIIDHSKTWEEHVVALNQECSRLKAAGPQAIGSKGALATSQQVKVFIILFGKCFAVFSTTRFCSAQEELLYLGHSMARQGILPDDSSVANIAHCITPRNVT